MSKSLGDRVCGPGGWGREKLEESYDRDDALRAARPVTPSTSETPRRCCACREWASADAMGLCTKCRIPFDPAPLVGLEPVR